MLCNARRLRARHIVCFAFCSTLPALSAPLLSLQHVYPLSTSHSTVYKMSNEVSRISRISKLSSEWLPELRGLSPAKSMGPSPAESGGRSPAKLKGRSPANADSILLTAYTPTVDSKSGILYFADAKYKAAVCTLSFNEKCETHSRFVQASSWSDTLAQHGITSSSHKVYDYILDGNRFCWVLVPRELLDSIMLSLAPPRNSKAKWAAPLRKAMNQGTKRSPSFEQAPGALGVGTHNSHRPIKLERERNLYFLPGGKVQQQSHFIPYHESYPLV